MNKLKIAFISLARTTFDIPYAQDMVERASKALVEAGLDLIIPAELITNTEELENSLQVLDDTPVDLVVVFQATFADSSMTLALSKQLKAPLLLWAVPEPNTGGRLRLNSFCGITLAGHALTRAGVYYGHVFASPEDQAAVETVTTYARAGRAYRVLRQSRLGRVGENPTGFETCLFDSDRIKKRFGLDIIQLGLQEDIFSKVRAINLEEIEPIRKELDQRVDNLDDLEPAAVSRSLATYQVLKDISEDQDLQAFAVRCWPEFFTDLGCAACGAMSMLTDELIPCSCEADINGTITQLILQLISGGQSFGTDMVSVDEDRDALVLWHCGLAPLSMADPESEKRVTIHSNRKLPLLMEFSLKPGPVTFARLSEARGEFTLAVGEGEIIRGPQSFSGTSGLLTFGTPVQQVINTLLDEGLEHHISLTYGHYQKELIALAKIYQLPIIQIN